MPMPQNQIGVLSSRLTHWVAVLSADRAPGQPAVHHASVTPNLRTRLGYSGRALRLSISGLKGWQTKSIEPIGVVIQPIGCDADGLLFFKPAAFNEPRQGTGDHLAGDH